MLSSKEVLFDKFVNSINLYFLRPMPSLLNNYTSVSSDKDTVFYNFTKDYLNFMNIESFYGGLGVDYFLSLKENNIFLQKPESALLDLANSILLKIDIKELDEIFEYHEARKVLDEVGAMPLDTDGAYGEE